MALKYQRILLKISGEALGGEKGMGFDEPTMDAICGGVKKAHDLGVQIGIVVGGGNFWRGRSSGKMERTLADKIGMLATVMNALAVSDKLETAWVCPLRCSPPSPMPQGGTALYPQGCPARLWMRQDRRVRPAAPATRSSPRIRQPLCALWK